jgi:hypothetical protein
VSEEDNICFKNEYRFELHEREYKSLAVNLETIVDAAIGEVGEPLYHAPCNIEEV